MIVLLAAFASGVLLGALITVIVYLRRVGRLQTDRDKQRLLDGMGSSDGSVDVNAIGDRISRLDKRQFVLLLGRQYLESTTGIASSCKRRSSCSLQQFVQIFLRLCLEEVRFGGLSTVIHENF